MKPEARLIGFDDGPFTFDDDRVPIAGVMTRGGGYVEAVLVDEITVDGDDATDTVLALLEGSGFLETAHAVAFDGGALGGFNVVDLERVHEALGLPAIAVMRERPDPEAVQAALAEHFEDHEARYERLTRQPIQRVDLGTGPALVRHVGGQLEEIEALLAGQTVRGREPEPLRIAHLVATALKEGRSRGA